MKYCSKCGNTMEDNSNFCNVCGAKSATAESVKANEQRCLDKLSTGLKHERLAYKIGGIVWVALASIIIIASLIMLVTGSYVIDTSSGYVVEYDDNGYYTEDFDTGVDVVAGSVFIGLGSGYFSMGLVFLGVGIVNFVLSSKVGKYRNNIYTDCTIGANHAGSVGSIVLAAFFNEVALVFVIINFVFMKRNASTFENIKANQLSFNSQF